MDRERLPLKTPMLGQNGCPVIPDFQNLFDCARLMISIENSYVQV